MKGKIELISKLNKWFLKDENTIYYLNRDKPTPIPNVDYQTFKVFSFSLAGDYNSVYAISTQKEGLQIFEDADMENIIFIPENIGENYFVDNQNLYRYNGHFIEYCNVIYLSEHEIQIKQYLMQNYSDRVAWWNYDLDFYENLESISANHFRSANKIFYYFWDDKDLYDYPTYQTKVSGFNFEHDGCFICIREADVDSFQVLNEIYSKDKYNVYFHSRKIKADADTFKIIDQLFAKDKNGIWYNGRRANVVKEPDSFEIITKNQRRCDGHMAQDNLSKYSSKNSRISQKGYALVLKKIKEIKPNR